MSLKLIGMVLKNKTFMLTGKLDGMSRAEAKSLNRKKFRKNN